MEVAASLVTSAASVTVIGKDPVPFFASLGEQVALSPCHYGPSDGKRDIGDAQCTKFIKIDQTRLQVGRFLLGMHRENKVQFCLNEQVHLLSNRRESSIWQ